MGRRKIVAFNGDENAKEFNSIKADRRLRMLQAIADLDKLRPWIREGRALVAQAFANLGPPQDGFEPAGIDPADAERADTIMLGLWHEQATKDCARIRSPVDTLDVRETLLHALAALDLLNKQLPAPATRDPVDVFDEDYASRGWTREEIATLANTSVDAIDHKRKARPK